MTRPATATRPAQQHALARGLLAAGRAADALALLAGDGLPGDDREAELLRATARWQLGDTSGARTLLEQLAPEAGPDPRVDLLLGQVERDAGQDAPAAVRLSAASLARPHDAALAELAAAAALPGSPDDADGHLRRLGELRRDAVSDHLAGRIALARGDHAVAGRRFADALAADEELTPARLGLAVASRRSGAMAVAAEQHLASTRQHAGGLHDVVTSAFRLRRLRDVCWWSVLVALLTSPLIVDLSGIKAVLFLAQLALVGTALAQVVRRRALPDAVRTVQRGRVLDVPQRMSIAFWTSVVAVPLVTVQLVLAAFTDQLAAPVWLAVLVALLPVAVFVLAGSFVLGYDEEPGRGDAWLPYAY